MPHAIRQWFRATGMSAVLVLAVSRPASALEPEDIAVVFNTRSPGSLQVARYYMNARKIPANHLLPITCDAAENISEANYRTLVVPQLLKALGDRKLLPDPKSGAQGIKCLVTTYDVPLRILAHEPTAPEKAEIADYQQQLDDITADIASHIRLYDSLAPAPATQPATGTAPATGPATKPTWQSLIPQAQQAANAAGGRIMKLPERERTQALQLLISLQEHMMGIAGILNSISVPVDAPNADAARKQLADMAAELKEGQQQYQALVPQRDSPRIRKEMVALRRKFEGVIGQARALEDMLSYLKPEQTAACFDNELALLLADQTYQRPAWIPNPRSLESYAATQRAGATVLPTLLVCRLDGLTPDKATQLVATAIQVEAKGLDGKLYLDARGLRGADAYAGFDADIRKTADWMKAHSTMETVLEDTPNFLEAKDAPDAALYCGWYSLQHYLDSAQWVKGAVGYHVASFEMMSLHNPKETGWVPGLLNHGFAGTLGPTDEPYLHSFPKPSQFFPLLLSGEFTQGEVWQVTCPLLSWRQGFVGDPLYNPFKAKPRVKVDELTRDPLLRNAFPILGHDVKP
jgi:uncharacterized protein (TIGR03790 family)